MAYIDAIKYNRIRSMKGLPIGAIIPWATDQSTIPPGWILCNGATISERTYPLLFDVIGNTYGGTPGSTFRLPPLTNSGKAIVDIFRGHYNWLKTNGGVANAPTSSSIANDRFWNIVATGDGNQGSTNQDGWPSTFDVVGQFRGSPNLFGLYDDIEVTEGTYSYTATWSEERLLATNLQSHGHGVDTGSNANSYQNDNGHTRECRGIQSDGAQCNISCDTVTANRVAANPQNTGGGIYRGDNNTNLVNNFTFTQTFTGGAGIGTGGGGTTITTPPGNAGDGGFGESGSTIYDGGDGRCQGDMTCGGFTVFFTSLSNSQTSLGQVAAHSHGVTTFNLQGRYRVINPGLRNNISFNTVAINNTPGQTAGNIFATTSTASLEMVYIIRAY